MKVNDAFKHNLERYRLVRFSRSLPVILQKVTKAKHENTGLVPQDPK